MSVSERRRAIVHVDMDAFYASVEQHDHPEYRGKPVIVGGDSRRGVVAASSYEARTYGIYSAMSMVEAKQRCPNAIIVFPRMERYVDVSRQVFEVFHRFTPLVEGLSLDEAFLDVTGSQSLFGDSVTIAKAIKKAIFDDTGLRASAGVAPSKFVAKIASALDKPDGLVVVARESVREFLAPLPIRKMWGVGPKAAQKLNGCGFETIGDLADASPSTLRALMGSWGHDIVRLAQGIDDRPVIPSHDAKSIGGENTFAKDLRCIDALEGELLGQTVRVAARLHDAGLWGGIVTVKVKYSDHRSKTRQKRLSVPAADTDTLFEVGRELLTRFEGLESRGVRLIGISVSDLQGKPSAGLFPDERRQRNETLEALAGELRSRFGKSGTTRARLIKPKKKAPSKDKPGSKKDT